MRNRITDRESMGGEGAIRGGLVGALRRSRARWVAVLTVAALVLAVAQVSADDTDALVEQGQAIDSEPQIDLPDVSPLKPGELNDALLEDLATVAEDEGISLDEAVERHGWHESFSMLVNDIRQKHRGSFAGARIERNGNPWIAFRSAVPEAVEEEIAEFVGAAFTSSDYAVDLKPDRGFTEAELDRRLLKAHYAALGQRELVANASSGYDVATGVITVEIELAEAVKSQRERERVAAEGVDANSAALRGVTVRVVDEVRGTNDVRIHGGHALGSCTSGFSVRSGSTRGVSTAGHCGNYLSYPLSGPDVTLVWQDGHDGWWGDFQWHTSSAYEADDSYAGPFHTNLRDVSRVAFATEGELLYRNGKATGRQWDYVYQLNHCIWSRCHLTLMDHREGSGGDSGGPSYLGNSAYGIHSGSKWWGGHSRDAFSPANYMTNALPGVYVATW